MDELKTTVTEVLKKRGVLGKFKAQLRKTIISVLDENENIYMENKKAQEIQESEEGKLIADLIREFLDFYELEYTSSVFIPEANLAPTSSSREQLLEKLNLSESSDSSKPVLFNLLTYILHSSSSPSAAGNFSASTSTTISVPKQDQDRPSRPVADSISFKPSEVASTKVPETRRGSESKKPEETRDGEQYGEEDFEPESDIEDDSKSPSAGKKGNNDSPSSYDKRSPKASGEGDDDKFTDNVSFSDVTATQSDVGELRDKYSYVEDINQSGSSDKVLNEEEEDEYTPDFGKFSVTTSSRIQQEAEDDDDDHF